MYSLIALLGWIAMRLLPARVRPARTTASAPGRGGWSASRCRSRRCSTRTTGRSSSRSPAASRGWCCSGSRDAPSAARAAARRPARASAARSLLYLPWIPTTLYQAAHTGAPWSERAGVRRAARRARRMLGRMPQIVLLICAGAGLMALLARRGRRLEPAGARRRRAGRARRARRCSSPGCLAGLAGVGQPLPRGRAAAARPAGAAGLAHAGRLGLVGLIVVVDHVGAGRRAGREEQRARGRRRDRPEPGARRPRRSPPSPRASRCCTTTCRRACATRRLTGPVERPRRVGLARRRRAAGGDDARARPQAADRRARSRASGVVLVEPISTTLSRWQAPWTLARPRIRSQGVVAVPRNDPQPADQRRSSRQLHAAAAESGAGDGVW